MTLKEPGPNRFDVRGPLCGVPLRIHPLYWCSAAVLGVRYLADPEAGSPGYFAFWNAAVLASLLFSAWGQARLGRLFGLRGTIVLDGLGSHIQGVGTLPHCWKRVVVLLSGPLIQFLLAGLILGLIELVPFPDTLRDWGWQSAVANGSMILLEINLAWGVINFLPVWPLAGGRVAVDLGETLLGSRGQKAALVLSLVVLAGVSIGVVVETSWHLSFRFDPRYVLFLEEGLLRLLYCFILWLGAFKALWGSDQERTGVPAGER